MVVNVTVTDPGAAGYLSVYPAGTSRPSTSNLNFLRHNTVANLAVVRVGAGGGITIFNGSSGTVNVIADITGYYSVGTATAGGFTAVGPSRVLDTRSGVGGVEAPVAAGATITVQAAGRGGVPAAGVAAVVVNVTVTDPGAAGYLSVYPAGTPLPSTSNLNFLRHNTVANLAVVRVGAGGGITIFNGSSGTVNVIADITGYYSVGTATAGGFTAVGPSRVLDTRSGVGGVEAPVAAGATITVQAAGRGGVPAAGVAAVVVNVTVTDPGAAGYLSVYPAGTSRPSTSNLNFLRHNTVANLAVVRVGAGGGITIFNGSSGTVNIIADITGYTSSPDSNRSVFTWARNNYGQLGNGTANSDRQLTPAQVHGIDGVRMLAAGGDSDYALRADGTVRAWGVNSTGNLGDGSTIDRATPVAVTGLTNVVGIAAALFSGYALKSDGTVWAWGYNYYGALGDGTTVNRLTPVRVANLSEVVAISASYESGYAVKSDGSVWAWGLNDHNQLGDGSTTSAVVPVQVKGLGNIVSVAAQGWNGYALRLDGTVWAWGANAAASLGNGSPDQHGISGASIPVQVTGLTGVKAIAAGVYAGYALYGDGTMSAWGSNYYGELGDGTTTDRLVPVKLGLTHVAAVGAGHASGYAVIDNGTAMSWGENGYGELGDGTTATSATPHLIPGISGVSAITGGENTAVAIAEPKSIPATRA